MLEHEVAVQQHGLHFGKQVIVAIQIGPASLHHAYGGGGERMYRPHQEVARWNEIGIEDGDELAGCRLHPFLERSGLVSMTVGAVEILDRESLGAILAH